jgi:hypothetical protein
VSWVDDREILGRNTIREFYLVFSAGHIIAPANPSDFRNLISVPPQRFKIEAEQYRRQASIRPERKVDVHLQLCREGFRFDDSSRVAISCAVEPDFESDPIAATFRVPGSVSDV